VIENHELNIYHAVYQDAFKWPALQKANGCLPFHTAQRLLEGLSHPFWIPSARDLQRCGVFASYEGPTDRGGRPHGAGGHATLVSGDTYRGSFHHGAMHGRGEYLWADGIKYTGAVVENELTGQGKIEWPSGDVYVGQVCKGFRHGVGTHTKVGPARARAPRCYRIHLDTCACMDSCGAYNTSRATCMLSAGLSSPRCPPAH
jgi:hypothetical protein